MTRADFEAFLLRSNASLIAKCAWDVEYVYIYRLPNGYDFMVLESSDCYFRVFSEVLIPL